MIVIYYREDLDTSNSIIYLFQVLKTENHDFICRKINLFFNFLFFMDEKLKVNRNPLYVLLVFGKIQITNEDIFKKKFFLLNTVVIKRCFFFKL